MPDFWPSCGYRLLTVGSDGRLTLTDEFLRALLLRPELAPIPESCAAELALHEKLIAAPRATVANSELAPIADADARENYAIWLRFRQRLAGFASIEAAYIALFRDGVDVPPLLVHQLTQILLRHVLGSDADPIHARVAEMLFRPQKVALRDDGAVMAADEVTVELFATTGGFGSLGELLQRNQTPARTVDLDVLDATNAASYWDRDERYDLAVSLNRGQPALTALCRVLEKWIAHFLGVAVTIRPLSRNRGPAMGVARRPRRRGECASQRSLQRRRRRRRAARPAALPVRAALRRSGGGAREHFRSAGVPRDGDRQRGEAQAEAAEPAREPSARANAMILEIETGRTQ